MYWATVHILKNPHLQNNFLRQLSIQETTENLIKMFTSVRNLYRNDYSFSVVPHMMSGFVDKGIPNFRTSPFV